MNTTPEPNDIILDEEARLTAFVLGELEPSEAAAFAARVEHDAALEREVEAIRRTVEVVTADLNRETVPGLTPEQRATIERGPAPAVEPRSVLYSFATMRNLWAGVGLAAAACLAVVLWPSVSVGPGEEGLVALDAPAARRAEPQANAPGTDARAIAAELDAVEAVGEVVEEMAGEMADRVAAPTEPPFESIGGRARLQAEKSSPGDEGRVAQSPAPGAAGLASKKKEQEPSAGAGDFRKRAVSPPASRDKAAPAPARRDAGGRAGGGAAGSTATADPDGSAEDMQRTAGRGELTENEAPSAAPDDEAAVERGAATFGNEGFRQARENRRSTFPLDVPTGSYDEVRAALSKRQLPGKDAVRIEELVNHFDYEYPVAPDDRAFAFDVETGACPWQPDHRLVRIGLRARNAAEHGEDATVARAVDVEVDLNPERVEAYRLIGYANAAMATSEAADEHGIAEAINAGRRVTALYEVVPRAVDGDAATDELMTIRLRYQEPGDGSSRLLEHAVVDAGHAIEDASDDYRFAAAVAWFGLVLREDPEERGGTFDALIELATPAPKADRSFNADIDGGVPPDRYEFMKLVQRAGSTNRRLLREADREER